MSLLALTWDSWLSIVLSIMAIVIAFLSAVFTYRADRRDEERIERERTEAETVGRARLVIEPFGATPSIDNTRFGFKIRNHGRAVPTTSRSGSSTATCGCRQCRSE